MHPNLVAVAYGTRAVPGPDPVKALMAQVARRLPGVSVTTTYLEPGRPHGRPGPAELLAAGPGPSVAVPLLLSSGQHLRHELSEAARRAAHPTRVARAVGPHPLLAAAMAQRLQAAGAQRGDAVVVVAAGTDDADGLVDTFSAGRLLRAHWGAPVRVAHLSGRGHTVQEVVADLRRQGHARVVAAPYLLVPGALSRQARALATANGCVAVADVLGAHPLLAEVVIRRFLAVCRPQLAAARVA